MSDSGKIAGTSYRLSGNSDGPVLLFIHGLGLSKEIWAPVFEVFAKDYRLLSYDLYGHGASDPAPQKPDLHLYSKQILSLLDELNVSSVHLVGFSIGGMINRRFAMDQSDRVNSLIILNSPHNRGDTLQEEVEARARSVAEEGPLATLETALLRWFTDEFRAGDLEALNKVREYRLDVDPESYAGAAWVLANGVRELIAPKPPIALPSLVITCENDTGSTPKMSQDIANEIAGAELAIIPNLKHLGLIEDPKLFTDKIDAFVKGLEA